MSLLFINILYKNQNVFQNLTIEHSTLAPPRPLTLSYPIFLYSQILFSVNFGSNHVVVKVGVLRDFHNRFFNTV
jgi:hypothetical protein